MSIQTRESALQNEIVRLYCKFEHNGDLADPAGQPLVEILDIDGVTVIDSLSAQAEKTGLYYVDFYVPANLPLGNYYDRWTYQWTATSGVTEQTQIFSVFSLDTYINSVSPAISHNVDSRTFQLLLDLQNDFIYEAMHIPVYGEEVRRMQEDYQQKRVKNYYYFTLDSDTYTVVEGAEYFHNGQRYTVVQSLSPQPLASSSTSSSESVSYSTSSSQTQFTSSSSSSTSSSSSSSGELSSSTSSQAVTTTTTTWGYQPILFCTGTGDPLTYGTLTFISGTGSASIAFTSYTKKVSRFSTAYNAAYHNWNRDPRPVVWQNNMIRDDGWFVDYNGKIFFDGLMAPEDNVKVDYKFAYFSTEELLSFLRLGLKMMNATPPASETYATFTTMPSVWDAGVLLYAAITALKRLVLGLSWQEIKIIYGDLEAAQAASSRFIELKDEYYQLWVEIRKDIKTRKLPGIAQYVTPEYTLPGGRSRWFRYLYKSSAGA